MTMKRNNLAQRVPVVGMVLLFTALVSVVSASQASAQGNPNPTLLQALQSLQSTVNALQTAVNALQTTVNSIVTNGVPSRLRRYYLTFQSFDGASALTACEAGFHMASLWEIRDPSNLRYDTVLGIDRDDSGEGPPTSTFDFSGLVDLAGLGWIRTGAGASTSSELLGSGNCSTWSTNPNSAFGTLATLTIGLTQGATIDPWLASVDSCDKLHHVWCAEDYKR